MEQVKKHLAMVFHRFIENGKIKIYFQDRVVRYLGILFLYNESTTQIFPEEFIQNGKVSIKGYVLPHKSKINRRRLSKKQRVQKDGMNIRDFIFTGMKDYYSQVTG